MERIPGVMFIIDTRREHIAVKEARKLGVKTMALIDTDSDPDLIDLPIPGNDDAMRAIEMILQGTCRCGDRRQDRPRQDQGRRAAATPAPQHPHRLPGRGSATRRGCPRGRTRISAHRSCSRGSNQRRRKFATDENQMHTDHKCICIFSLPASDFVSLAKNELEKSWQKSPQKWSMSFAVRPAWE